MCGRFDMNLTPAQAPLAFPSYLFPDDIRPRFNVAPATPLLAVANDESPVARWMHWGLVPSWSKDGKAFINARAETAATLNSFRVPFRRHRCIVFATGFYEWAVRPGGKVPFHFAIRDVRPFAFAGIYDMWKGPDGAEVVGACLLTNKPNPLVGGVHDRMPVILRRDDYERWLMPGELAPDEATSMLVGAPESVMTAHEVSKAVNNVKNDGPELLDTV